MITLYDKPTCVFCFRVRLCLGFLGVPWRRLDHVEYRAQWQALTPVSTVPVMVHDETGVVLTDSGIILEYLEDTWGGLLPDDAPTRAQAREWLHYADNPLGKALKHVIFERRDKPEPEWDLELIERSEAAFHATLPAIEAQLEGRDFLVGRYTFADAALTARLALGQKYGAGLPDGFPNLSRWFAARLADPFFPPAAPDGIGVRT